MPFNLITDQPDIVGPWVCARTGGVYCPQISQAIGQVDKNGNLVAAVLFEGFNGATVRGHFAVEPTARLQRQFLWAIGDYAFRQRKVRKVIGPVCSTNTQALRVNRKMGFKEEAVIEGGTPNGDLILMTLKPEDYRYIGITIDEIVRRL